MVSLFCVFSHCTFCNSSDCTVLSRSCSCSHVGSWWPCPVCHIDGSTDCTFPSHSGACSCADMQLSLSLYAIVSHPSVFCSPSFPRCWIYRSLPSPLSSKIYIAPPQTLTVHTLLGHWPSQAWEVG